MKNLVKRVSCIKKGKVTISLCIPFLLSLRSISSYYIQMRDNKEQKTWNTDTFQAVLFFLKFKSLI